MAMRALARTSPLSQRQPFPSSKRQAHSQPAPQTLGFAERAEGHAQRWLVPTLLTLLSDGSTEGP